jgi:HD-GYP domain-containing protein (c-di-GMP phosphodiesterase class II)
VIRLLPRVFAATALVAVSPLLAVWGLGRLHVVDSPLLAAALGAALSLALYHLAATFWQRRPDAADVLFGDLMLWGWVRRCVQQRRITDAAALLGAGRGTAGHDPMQLSPARRARMLERLASDLEARDAYTLGHSRRVARYSALIAKRMGVPKAELSRIRTAGAVHDIGKLQTPLDVLRKPGALTDAEFILIKRHPVDGAQIVAILEDDTLTETVLRHHERLDGSGYPGGLRGGEVSLGARIVAVADTFDALTSSRSYRAASSHKQALDILRAEAGSRLDDGAVDAFLSAYLGRRPFGAWIALTDLGERLLAWLAGDAAGTGSRLAAIAGTVAVGSGAVALHAPTHVPGGASAPRLSLTRERVSFAGHAPAGARSTGAPRAGDAAATVGAETGLRFRAVPRRDRGARPGGRTGGHSPGTAIGVAPSAPPTSSTAALPGTASGAGGPGSSSATGSGYPPGSPSAGSTVALGAGSRPGATKVGVGIGTVSGVRRVSVGASTGNGSSASSVGVQLTGGSGGGSGSAGSVSAGVSVGQTSAGVTATVGVGHGPAGTGVGISIGGLAPIKIG